MRVNRICADIIGLFVSCADSFLDGFSSSKQQTKCWVLPQCSNFLREGLCCAVHPLSRSWAQETSFDYVCAVKGSSKKSCHSVEWMEPAAGMIVCMRFAHVCRFYVTPISLSPQRQPLRMSLLKNWRRDEQHNRSYEVKNTTEDMRWTTQQKIWGD